MFSDNTAQHLSSAGSPPPPPVNGTAADDVPPHRVSVYRCGSPPTGRSVSFQCGQVHRSETDGCGAGRSSGRRQSATVGEPKEAAATMPTVPVVSITGLRGTQHHVEDELASVHSETTTTPAPCPSGIRVCKCVYVHSPPSKLVDVEGCRPASGNDDLSHKTHPTTDAVVDETSQPDIDSKQPGSPECCVIHVSSSS